MKRLIALVMILVIFSSPLAVVAQRTNTSETTPTPEVTRTERTPEANERKGRTTRTTPTPVPDNASDIFDEGEWEFEDSYGDQLYVTMYEVPSSVQAEEVIEDFDPMELAVEVGVEYIGENPNPIEGCRQFTYGGGFFTIFIAMCLNDDMVLFVMSTHHDDMEFVAERFMDNDPMMIPNYYDEVYN